MIIINLSEQLKQWRIDRPDEWKMDEFIRQAKELEDIVNDLKCCGNCENAHVVNIDTYCEMKGEQINCHKACPKWYPDGLAKEDRE